MLRVAPMAWLAAAVGRITVGMVVIGLVLLARRSGYSYAEAGLLAGAHSIGIGLIGPIQGRLADRFGQHRVLLVDAVAYFAALVAVASLVASAAALPAVLAVALLAGAVNPPLPACARVAWRTRYGPELREAAFSLDAVMIEAGFILGPVLAVVLVESVAPGAGVVGAGVAALVGAGGFALTDVSRSVTGSIGSGRSLIGALGSVGVRWSLLVFLLISVVFGVVDIVVPAITEEAGRPAAAGVLLALFASGSLVGGIVYGSRDWPGTLLGRLRIFVLSFGVLLAATPFVATSVTGLGVALLVAGCAIAPMAICLFQVIDELALAGTATEALTWASSSNVAGAAAGAVIAGVLVERSGPGWAMAAGAMAVLGAAALTWTLSRDGSGRLVATAP